MTSKVKRGLGLLVLALIGWLLLQVANESGGGAASSAVGMVGYLLAVVGAMAGLVLLAWGLLRD